MLIGVSGEIDFRSMTDVFRIRRMSNFQRKFPVITVVADGRVYTLEEFAKTMVDVEATSEGQCPGEIISGDISSPSYSREGG